MAPSPRPGGSVRRRATRTPAAPWQSLRESQPVSLSESRGLHRHDVAKLHRVASELTECQSRELPVAGQYYQPPRPSRYVTVTVTVTRDSDPELATSTQEPRRLSQWPHPHTSQGNRVSHGRTLGRHFLDSHQPQPGPGLRVTSRSGNVTWDGEGRNRPGRAGSKPI